MPPRAAGAEMPVIFDKPEPTDLPIGQGAAAIFRRL